jgi:hypothetical protein
MAARKPFLLRMDPALWAELEAWAQDELRSVNGQIEYLLKQAVLKRRGGVGVRTPEPPATDSGGSCDADQTTECLPAKPTAPGNF